MLKNHRQQLECQQKQAFFIKLCNTTTADRVDGVLRSLTVRTGLVDRTQWTDSNLLSGVHLQQDKTDYHIRLLVFTAREMVVI